MSSKKKFTRNELKAFLNVLKNELGVEYNTRDITNIEGCKKSLKEIADIYADKKNSVNTIPFGFRGGKIPKDVHFVDHDKIVLKSENVFLKAQITELKKQIKEQNKKSWWQFWK